MRSYYSCLLSGLVLFCLFGMTAEARMWTSSEGKKIEAEMVRLEGDSVVLKIKGKEITLPLSRLSEEDAAFARGNAEAASVIMIEGNKIVPGERTTFTIDFNDDEKRLAKNSTERPMQARLTFLLHKDFDPAKENKIFFARTTGDGKDESGDIRAMGFFEGVARDYGWNLAVFDSPKGLSGDPNVDIAIFAAGLRVMEKTWPGCSKTWKFGAGGISGGAKSSQNLVAVLSRNRVNMDVLFLSGCNCFLGYFFKERYRVDPKVFSKARIFISNGLSDTISPVSHAQGVYDDMKRMGKVKKIRFEKYEGGHEPGAGQVEMAFKWFEEELKEK